MNNPIQKYRQLREEVDQKTAQLEEMHADHILCQKGCCDCCMNLTVWPVEFYSILREMQEQNWPVPALHPAAGCVYLEEGVCQIYPFRPLICRTHGLPLVYWHDDTDPPGYGIIFCQRNFIRHEEIAFTAENTLNMDEVNEQLAAANIAFIEQNPDLNLEPSDRIQLKHLIDHM